MTRKPLAGQFFVKIATLVSVAVLSVLPSPAQSHNVEIMVNGPWTFVAYANPNISNGDKRLYLVAGWNKYHFVNISTGTDARMSTLMTSIGGGTSINLICPGGPADKTSCLSSQKQNLYLADFDSTQAGTYTLTEETEGVYPEVSSVSSQNIATVLLNPTASRYAISLPWPNHIHTYSGDFGPGVSEAKIQQNTDPDYRTATAQFATWTVLSYDVQPNSVNVKTYNASDQSAFSVKISTGDTDRSGAPLGSTPNPIKRYGINISLMEAPLCKNSLPSKALYYPEDCPTDKTFSVPLDDQECDTLSSLSFAQSAALWNLPEHARFPSEQDALGTQGAWNYDYSCLASYGGNLQNLEVQEDKVVSFNLEMVPRMADLAQRVATLKRNLAVIEHQRHESGQEPGESLAPESVIKLFNGISKDLSAPESANLIPSENTTRQNLADELYCACKAFTSGRGNCQSFKSSSHECKAVRDVTEPAKHFITAATAYVTANDKGSSDCHAAQISINGAIQPTP
jgi:hypothetical protein